MKAAFRAMGTRQGTGTGIFAVLVLALMLALAQPYSAQAQLTPGSRAQAPSSASSVWDGSADTSWYDPSATSFTLDDPAQLAGLAAIVNGTAEGVAQDDFAGKTVQLAADVQLNAYAATQPDAAQRSWTPIGARPATGTHSGSGGMQPVFADPSYFRGTFDGQGHVIKNLYINKVSYPDANYPGVSDYGGYQGPFGALGEGAVVKNLGIYGGFVAGRVAGGIAALGAPASAQTAPLIVNCYNTATIVGDGSSSRGSGGLFGGEYGSEGDNGLCRIVNCYNAGDVQGKGGNAGATLGGVAGCGPVQVFSCYDAGVVADSPSAYRGALVGLLAKGGTVADSFGLSQAHGALYCDATGDPVTEGLISADALSALVKQGKLSAAFVDGASGEPELFWEQGLADPIDLTGKAVVEAVAAQVYTGSAITPALTVTYDGRTLKPGSDYQVRYANNVDATTPDAPATFTVDFIGRYAGTATGTFLISSSTLDAATIEGLGPQWSYGSQPVVPAIVVKDAAGRKLKEGKDYELVLSGNDAPGIAQLRVQPCEGSSFIGSKEASFAIVAASDKLAGSGTEEDPYIVASRADLQYLAHTVNTLPAGESDEADTLSGVFRLSADVDMTGTDDEPAVDLIGASTWSDDEGYRTKAFAGTLDGAGHTLTMRFQATDGYFGLFPTNAEGTTVTVKDLKLAGSITTPATAAVLFPSVYGTLRLEDVTNAVDVTAGYKAYGLIGGVWPRNNSVTLERCENAGDIQGGSEAAGLVGELNANSAAGSVFVVKSCLNSGTVKAGEGGTGSTGTRAAGVLGKLTQFQSSTQVVDIRDTANQGAVSADGTAGGLVASLGSSDGASLASGARAAHLLSGCCNTGDVTAGKIAGGLVGGMYDSNRAGISNAYNTGAVTALGDAGVAGGLVGGTQTGRAWFLELSGAYSVGSVDASQGNAGAIVGFAGCGSYYAVSGGELKCADVHYLASSAPAAIGTLQPQQELTYFTYPAAKLVGDDPAGHDEAQMKQTGQQGMAALLGSQFEDDVLRMNQGFPVLYWQMGAVGPIDLAQAVIGSIADVEYTGSQVVPQVPVTLNGVALKQGSDYLVQVIGDAVEAREGVAVQISGIGRYAGTVDAGTFAIAKADLGGFAIDDIDAQWASASDPAQPEPVLRNRAGVRVYLADGFTVTYADNAGGADQGSVTVTAAQDNRNYTGSLTASFAVRALPDDLEGAGTLSDPFKIATYQQLELFAKRVDAARPGYPEACAQLTADISIPADVTLDPIGDGTSEYVSGAPFKGVFDGAGHVITLDYRTPTTYSVFNGLQGATVKNLAIAGTTTVAMQDGTRPRYGGTFAGLLDASVTFQNCVNAATVLGTQSRVGGFAASTDDEGIPAVNYRAGTAEIKFVNCVNEGTIAAAPEASGAVDCVGGFMGYAYTMGFGGSIALTFENCTNTGEVSSAAGSSVGGILGAATYDYASDSEDSFEVMLRGVANRGPIGAYDGAGGLVGVMTDVDKLTVEDAYNTGTVSISCADAAHGQLAGGLVAVASSNSYRANPSLAIKNAYNAGAVTCTGTGEDSDPFVGGIIGGISYDRKYVTLRNVYYSLDKAQVAIGIDQDQGGWEDVVVPEYDETMKAPGFADELGESFVASVGENDGFPTLAAAKEDIGAYSVTFYDAKNRLGLESFELPWTGQAATPRLVVRKTCSLLSPELVLGRDYIVFYKNNVDAGQALAEVHGIGDYRGSVAVPFAITARGLIDDCTIAPLDEQVWTGEPIEPALTVTARVGGAPVVLEQGVDYTVTYGNNVNEGRAGALVQGVGAWSGSKTVTFRIWKPLITVKVRYGSGAPQVAKRYTKEQFQALASDGDPISALYFGDGAGGVWRLSTAKSYVTFADLFADAGVPWQRGVTVSYAAADDPAKESALSYTNLTSRYFYPYAEAGEIDTSREARPVPPALAIEERSSGIGDGGTLFGFEAEEANVGNATDANEPRVITGITAQEARDKSARGSRLIKNLDEIVVTVVDFDELRDAIAKAQEMIQKSSASADATAQLRAALDAARAIAADPDATQAQVSKELAALASAQEAVAAHPGDSSAQQGGKTSAKKAKNGLSVKAKAVTIKLGKAKKKSVAARKAFKVKGSNGAVTFKKVRGKAKIKVSKKGKVTVKKGLKPGTYTVRVKVKAAGDSKHKPATKTVKLKLRIK